MCPEEPSAHFEEPADEENPLQRIAEHELARLTQDLREEPVAFLLTDPRGVVLARSGGDNALLRRLDRINLAPGFSYNEEFMGTNGIGTALEAGQSMMIHGSEHYADSLKRFSCAGAVIQHPVNGRTLGLLDITLDAGKSNSVVLATARMVAARIREALSQAASHQDQALMAEFFNALTAATPVIAVGHRFTALSPAAQKDFCAADQAHLLEFARGSNLQAGTTILELPSGCTARLDARVTDVGGRPAGSIIRIQQQRQSVSSTSPTATVPGLAGSSAVWRRTVARALDVRRRGEWLVVEGEPGTGKLAILQAIERLVAPAHLPTVLDVRTTDPTRLVARAAETLAESRTLVVAHADQLGTEQVGSLCELLMDHEGSTDAPFVAITVSPDATDAMRHNLMTMFPHTVRVPPLRQHMEDLPELVNHLVGRRNSEVRLSPAALAQLGRLPWHGNVTELSQAIQAILKTRRAGVVQPEDLPAQCRATTRRQLTAMEWLERDAILDALDTHGGNKQKAAQALGMSRATIYRKIREYGLS